MARWTRQDGRRADELRPVRITPGFVKSADGSCLIEVGDTRVICTASRVEGVPAWREEQGLGWVTAEYGMLPASTGRRKSRPALKPDSRGVEIQRLIGRVLRNVVRFDRLGLNTICLDCDVLEADGGTRTAAITGAWVALALALDRGAADDWCSPAALKSAVAAVSVGILDGRPALDLDYREDSSADVDMNVVMDEDGNFVEIQGTAEGKNYSRDEMNTLLDLAEKGTEELIFFIKKLLEIE